MIYSMYRLLMAENIAQTIIVSTIMTACITKILAAIVGIDNLPWLMQIAVTTMGVSAPRILHHPALRSLVHRR